MAEVRVPFSVTTELTPPFKLDETYANPNGVKSVLIDKSNLQVVVKEETVDVPDVGQVQLCVFYVVGTVRYICNAFPVVQSDRRFEVQQQTAQFTGQNGRTASECVSTTSTDVLGWLSAAGCVHIDERVGGSCQNNDAPSIESVTVDDFAVANNLVPALAPTCPLSTSPCGEEEKRVVKWRGCIVITTTEPS